MFKKHEKKGRKSRMNEQELNAQEPENTAEEVSEAAGVIDVAALQAAAAKADEYLAMAQRTQADFDNFRRRNESVRADAHSEGQRAVCRAMLPVLDNLERALAADTPDGDALRTGVEMTLKQLLGVFEKLGVTAIDRLGEKFDPNLEEAILQGTADEGEPGTVCMVLQKGYMMGSTVLRHAMVKVVADA